MSTALIKRGQTPARVERGNDHPDQDEKQQKQMHFNYLQLICLAIGAQFTTAVAGRGTGKTVGVLAPNSTSYSLTAPLVYRCGGNDVCATR